MTYYRIQPADRDLADLLDETTWQSSNWNDEWAAPKFGVSVCDSIDALVDYYQLAGGYVDTDMVLVELVGPLSDDEDEDHEAGAILICPTRVISATPVTDDLIDRIYA